MPRVKLSEQARSDVLRLYEFIADKNPEAAFRAVEAIQTSFVPLATLPHIGRRVDDTLRELLIDFGNSGYVALYSVNELHDEVIVLATKHQLEDDYSTVV
jgi:plasmid stabilization system protein ParE